MSERKRQKTTKISEKNEILNRNTITKFQELPNELILSCFKYFDFYNLYKIFSCLNQRFNELISTHAKIYINFDSIQEEKFLTFCFDLNQFLTASRNYPLSMNISDEHKFSLILNDDLFKDKFCKLKSLSVGNMKITTLSYAIFGEESKLYKTLERLCLLDEISGEDYEINQLCCDLISSKMESLKYLNLNVKPYSCGCEHSLYTRENYVDLQFENSSKEEKSSSHLETFILGDNVDDDDDGSAATAKISFNTLTKNVLPYLPKLKNLIVKPIHFNEQNHKRRYRAPSTKEGNLRLPTNLKLIKIWIAADTNRRTDEKEKRKILQEFFMNNNSTEPKIIKVFNINNENVLKENL